MPFRSFVARGLRITAKMLQLRRFFTVSALLIALLCFDLHGQSFDTPPDDSTLERVLEKRLHAIDELQSVKVEVEGGIVTLSGMVSDSSFRGTAAEIALSQVGVIEVDNELVLGGELVDRVENAFSRVLLKLKMISGYIPLFVVALALLAAFALLARLISSKAVVSRLAGQNRFLQEVVRQGIKITILLIGIVVALDLLDAGKLVGAVFGAAGLAGLAIGFAFKDLIENYVASLLLSLRRPFRLNDHVQIGEHEGKVMSLNTRSTILMTLDGNHLRLPNALVFKSVILNYTTNAERRFDFVVGVGVEEDLVAAQRIGIETLRTVEGIITEPPPWAAITGLGDSNVTIQYFAWVDQTRFSFAKVKGEAIRRVKLALEAAGMDLPEPIHRVRLLGQESMFSEAQPPERSNTSAAYEEASADVTRDDAIDKQVAEEVRQMGGRNLLLNGTSSE